MEKIELEIRENILTSNWWSPAVKELFCALCEEKDCDPIKCESANPWCG